MPDGRADVVFPDSNPAMYDRTTALFVGTAASIQAKQRHGAAVVVVCRWGWRTV